MNSQQFVSPQQAWASAGNAPGDAATRTRAMRAQTRVMTGPGGRQPQGFQALRPGHHTGKAPGQFGPAGARLQTDLMNSAVTQRFFQ